MRKIWWVGKGGLSLCYSTTVTWSVALDDFLPVLPHASTTPGFHTFDATLDLGVRPAKFRVQEGAQVEAVVVRRVLFHVHRGRDDGHLVPIVLVRVPEPDHLFHDLSRTQAAAVDGCVDAVC